MDDAQLDGDRTPDFVLAILARRYTRLALALALPAGIFAASSFGLPLLLLAAWGGWELFLILGVILLAIAGVVLWRWVSKRRGRREDRAEPPLHPSDIEGLLELGEFLIAELERGDDRGFKWYVHDFVGALDRSPPELRAELQRRGVDRTRLRASLYTATDLPREPATERRALYAALQRFVTVVREPDGQAPYRSASDDGSELQAPVESRVEMEIRQGLRSRLVGIASVVALIWIAVAGAYLRAAGADSFEIEHALILALVATTLLVLVAARITHRAAERSWTAAHRDRPVSVEPKSRWLGAAMRLSWIPVLGWASYVVLTFVDASSRELHEHVWLTGLLTAAPVVVHALLIRRTRLTTLA